jgi:hypothetical protein
VSLRIKGKQYGIEDSMDLVILKTKLLRQVWTIFLDEEINA